MSLNKATLIGNLGNDPDVRDVNGQKVATFSLATNERWTDKNGEKQEHTEWHRIVVWGKLAEVCGQYLKKGRQTYVEGRIRTRTWDDKEGVKRYTTEINADTVQFLGGAGEKGDRAPHPADGGGAPPTGGGSKKSAPNVNEDDIPL